MAKSFSDEVVEATFKGIKKEVIDLDEVKPTKLAQSIKEYSIKFPGRNFVDDVMEIDRKLGTIDVGSRQGLTNYISFDYKAYSRINSKIDYWKGLGYTDEQLRTGYKVAWDTDQTFVEKLLSDVEYNIEHMTRETAEASLKFDDPLLSIDELGEAGADIKVTRLDGQTIYREMTSINSDLTGNLLGEAVGDKIANKWYQVSPGDMREFGIQLTNSADDVGTFSIDDVYKRINSYDWGSSPVPNPDRIILFDSNGKIIRMWVKDIGWVV